LKHAIPFVAVFNQRNAPCKKYRDCWKMQKATCRRLDKTFRSSMKHRAFGFCRKICFIASWCIKKDAIHCMCLI